jgi:hypothetical protein
LGFNPDISKSLCPDYVLRATLKKRNAAQFLFEEIRAQLGILHPGLFEGSVEFVLLLVFQGAGADASDATCLRYRRFKIEF